MDRLGQQQEDRREPTSSQPVACQDDYAFSNSPASSDSGEDIASSSETINIGVMERPRGLYLTEKKKRIDALNKIFNRLQEEFEDVYDEVLARRASVGSRALNSGMVVPFPLKSPPPDLTEEQIASIFTREKWRQRKNKSEKFPDFLKRVYGDLLGRGLVPSDFKRRDPNTRKPYDQPLYQARLDWMKNNDLPPEIDLPDQEEVTDRIAYAMTVDPSSVPLDKQARVKRALASREIRKLAHG